MKGNKLKRQKATLATPFVAQLFAVSNRTPTVSSYSFFCTRDIMPRAGLQQQDPFAAKERVLLLLLLLLLHASTVPRYAHTPLVDGSYNTSSPFAKTFNHVTFEGSYQSSVINICSYGFYCNCICKLDPLDDIRAYLILTIIYDFMAFISLYLRSRLGIEEPSLHRLSHFRNDLLQCVDDFPEHITIDPDNAQVFTALTEIFRALIKNASPIPRMPANGRRLRLLARDRAKYHF